MEGLINHVMLVSEAAYRWGKDESTIKQRLNPSSTRKSYDKYVEEQAYYEKKGLIRFWKKPGAKNGTWYVSMAYMELVYGPIKNGFE